MAMYGAIPDEQQLVSLHITDRIKHPVSVAALILHIAPAGRD